MGRVLSIYDFGGRGVRDGMGWRKMQQCILDSYLVLCGGGGGAFLVLIYWGFFFGEDGGLRGICLFCFVF